MTERTRSDERATSAERKRTLLVSEGDGQDVCPNCGIWRMNAGWWEATCGRGYLKPGCFIVAAEATERTE